MKFDKIIPTLTSIAPTIAAALGGPLAGMAVSQLESFFGLDQGATQVDDAALTKAVLGMSPETAASMRKADQDFEARMKQLDIDVIGLAEKDRESARAMQIQTKDITPRMLSFGVVAGLFTLLALMAFRDLPTANHDALMMLLGGLSTAFTSVIGFYFGSSASSQAKDAVIKDLKK